MANEEKTPKIPNLLEKIKECLNNGRYRFSQHALDRKKERFISLPGVLEVLNKGHHEKAKDSVDGKKVNEELK